MPAEHPPPIHHQPSTPVLPTYMVYGATVIWITELIWIKNLTTLGETSWGVFYGLMTLDHPAAPQHRPTGTCTGTRRAVQQGWEPTMGVMGLGTLCVGGGV